MRGKYFKSVCIDRHVNAGVGGDHLLLSGLSLNHALIEIYQHKLSHDFVAVFCISQADASVAISPKWLISRERVIDRLVNFIVFLLSHFIGSMRHTNCFRHALLKDDLDLTATVAILDQATVETVLIVFSAEFHTNEADE